MLCNMQHEITALLWFVRDPDTQEDRNAYESELGVFPVIMITKRLNQEL